MVQELVSLFLGAGEPSEQIEKLLDSITDLVQSVRPDGSFANSGCRAPVSGRINGNRMTMSQKHPEVFCDFEFQKP